MASQLGAAGVPNVGAAQNYINNYGSAPASSVNASTISSAMNPYMNQYVNYALAPQIEAQNQQFAQQNKGLDAAATSSGAFGDNRAGIEAANLTTQQNIGRQGLIGNAYNAAFNTAIGAGAQDVSNSLNAQTTNAGLNEQALARQLGAAGALQNLGTYQVNTGTNLANLTNQFGQQQTAQSQAGLTAAYNQWLMAQQYPFQTAQLQNQTVGAAANAMPAATTQTTQQPNNAGWAIGGALLGSLPMMLSDERAKENIAKIGALLDGTGVYRFNYKGRNPKETTIGVMAQEVEKTNPGAVVTLFPGGPKLVDYAKATAPSMGMAAALGIAA